MKQGGRSPEGGPKEAGGGREDRWREEAGRSAGTRLQRAEQGDHLAGRGLRTEGGGGGRSAGAGGSRQRAEGEAPGGSRTVGGSGRREVAGVVEGCTS